MPKPKSRKMPMTAGKMNGTGRSVKTALRVKDTGKNPAQRNLIDKAALRARTGAALSESDMKAYESKSRGEAVKRGNKVLKGK